MHSLFGRPQGIDRKSSEMLALLAAERAESALQGKIPCKSRCYQGRRHPSRQRPTWVSLSRRVRLGPPILRDARESALLRMKAEQAPQIGAHALQSRALFHLEARGLHHRTPAGNLGVDEG